MLFAAALLALLPAALAVDHLVVVGGTSLAFSPSSVQAAPGDTVTFEFHQKNHTATQSSLANPCTPLSGGFDTGFKPVDASVTSNFPTFRALVSDTNPTWVFCRQTGHCQQGMVFAINPGPDGAANSFAAFQAAAMGGAAPTTASVSASPSGTASAGGVASTHRIIVGGTGVLAFNPPNISAAVGDTITFEFHQKNHTATQSSFASPCSPLTSATGPGFDSGFMPVADGATTFPTYSIMVNNTAPIWAYCQQTGHCAQGMVFAANAVESGPNNFGAFQAKAKGSTTNSTSSSSDPYGTGAAPSRYGYSTATVLGAIAALVALLF